MKKKLNNFYVFLSLFFLGSCYSEDSCTKINLTKDELSWFKPYNAGDTLIYSTPKNEYDSLYVFDKTVSYTPCNNFEIGPDQYQWVYVGLQSFVYEERDQSYFDFRKRNLKGVCLKCFKVYDYRVCLDTLKNANLKTLYSPLVKDSAKCYNFKKSHPMKKDFIISFNWSKDFGLLSYTTKDSVEYVRIK